MGSSDSSIIHREAAERCRKLVREQIACNPLSHLLILDLLDDAPAAVGVVESDADQ